MVTVSYTHLIIALLGMATNYAEAVMAQKTRVVDEDGTVHGGPVYYLSLIHI